MNLRPNANEGKVKTAKIEAMKKIKAAYKAAQQAGKVKTYQITRS